jgi:hypothetical protein
MSDGIAALTEKVKTAQIELERATEALFTDVNSDNANGRYNQAILKLDRAEAELEAALAKFKRKKY